MKKIPDAIKPLISEYRAMLQRKFPDKIYGLYLFNSIALGAFDPQKSDIDFIVVLNGEFSESDTQELKELHIELLKKHKPAKKLEGMYLPKDQVGMKRSGVKQHLYYDHKKLRYGHHSINAVTWWTLKYNGVGVDSPDRRFLKIEVSPEDLTDAMMHNLNGYWKSKLNQKLIFLTDYWVEFSVLTLCRIIYTLQYKNVISKCDAARNVLSLVPEAHRDVILEALRIREMAHAKSPFPSIFSRRKAVMDFVRYCIETSGRL